MQKKLLTIAVASALAVPGVALAQNVTLFGTIDGGVRFQSKAGASSDRNTVMTDGLRTTNRWGFRGSEDLGGGLKANFWFEGQYNSDTGGGPVGAGLFQRQNWVGLSKDGMDLRIGRDYTVNFKSQGIYDPMSYTYTGIAPTAGTNTQGVRFSNLASAGFRFGTGGIRVDLSQGETVGADTGDAFGIMGDFTFGPVTVTAAYSTLELNAAGQTNDVTNIGARYVMGAFTFRAGWSESENEATNTKTPMYVLGVQYAISPTLNGRVGYYNLETEVGGTTTQKRKQVLVALDYMLSKRTTAYVSYDRLDLSMPGTVTLGGAQSGALNDGASAFSAGIAHSF